MKNYQVILEVLKFYAVFMAGYLFMRYCIPWNLEKNPKKLSEKFRSLNVEFFSAAICGIFPVYEGLRLSETHISFLNLFAYYYIALFAFTFFMVRQLSLIRKYEKWEDDTDILKKFYQESDNRSDQKEKIRKIFGKFVNKQLENESVYKFWSNILNRREAQ